VIISLDKASETLSSATIAVDYSQAQAKPVTNGGRPACASILPHVVADFSDDERGTLTVRARSAEGFSAPIDLAVCRMVPERENVTGPTISARLRISLTEGVDVAGHNLDERQLAHSRPRTYSRSSSVADGTAGSVASEDREAAMAHERRSTGAASERRTAKAENRQGAKREGGRDVPAAMARNAERSKANADGQIARADRQPYTDDERVGSGSRYSGGSRAGSAPGGVGTDGTGSNGGTSGADANAGEADRGHGGSSSSNDDSDDDTQALSYDVTVAVTSDSGVLGALQFDVTHLGSSGGFVGAGASVKCDPAVAVALTSFNDKGNGQLSAAFVDLQGFHTPTPVATCRFKTREQLSPQSFQVTAVDASAPGLEAANVLPTMAVTSVTP
jgi:hypothetical protein